MSFSLRSPFLFGFLMSVTLAACALRAPVADGEGALLPSSRAAAFLIGQAASRAGDLNLAASAWTELLQEDPDNVKLRHDAQWSALSIGDFEAALEHARHLEKLGDNDPYSPLLLVLDHVRAGRLLEADALLAKLSDRGDRGGVNAMLIPILRAWLAAGNRESKVAEALLAPLYQTKPLKPVLDLHRMLIADYLGHSVAALSLARDILRDDPVPIPRVAVEVGSVLERHGSVEEAQAFYESYREKNPDILLWQPALARLKHGEPPPRSIASVKEAMAESLFDLASLLQRSGQERDGLSALALLIDQAALAMRPDFVFSRLLLADIYESQSKPAKAADVLRSMIDDPSFGRLARLRLAVNLDAQGDTERALLELQNIIRKYPEADRPYSVMGDILRGRQRWQEAVLAYDRAIERIPALLSHHWPLLFSRAICLERNKQIDKAIADLERALAFEPDQPYLLNYLGYSWVDQGLHLQRATAMIEKAAQLRPDDGHIVDSLGWAHYRQGRFQEAAIQLERAVQLKPLDPTINDHLGDAYWQAGRKTEARNQWKRSQGLDPEQELKERLDAKLKGVEPLVTPLAVTP